MEALELPAPARIVNDTLVGLLAGRRGGWGIGLAAGTHCNCRGWDRERAEGRVVGFRMGEAAGAKALVDQAVYAVARNTHAGARRRVSPRPSSAPAGARDVDDLLEGLTAGRYALTAAAALIVFAEAERGDPVARELIGGRVASSAAWPPVSSDSSVWRRPRSISS